VKEADASIGLVKTGIQTDEPTASEQSTDHACAGLHANKLAPRSKSKPLQVYDTERMIAKQTCEMNHEENLSNASVSDFDTSGVGEQFRTEHKSLNGLNEVRPMVERSDQCEKAAIVRMYDKNENEKLLVYQIREMYLHSANLFDGKCAF